MQINRIEPPYWFKNQADDEVTLFVYGKELKDVSINLDVPNKSIEVLYQEDDMLIAKLLLKKHISNNKSHIEFSSKSGETISLDYNFLNREERSIEPLSPKDSIYLIVPDRFAQGKSTSKISDINRNDANAWHGGNINGIREHLSYIKELGITTIWLTPVFENNMPAKSIDGRRYAFYHGYAITNYYDIDPHFGTIEDYCNFIKEAHEMGMKVVMDVVMNHCGSNHPWLRSSIRKHWINGTMEQITNYRTTPVLGSYASSIDYKKSTEGWFTDNMADLNLTNPWLLEYMIQMTIWWIETTKIDGVRLDTYLYADFESMKQWQRRVRSLYPTLSIIAETWVPISAYTAKIQQEVQDSCGGAPLIVMDFAFQKSLMKSLKSDYGDDKYEALYNHFICDFMYPAPSNTLAFVDNHDMQRAMYILTDINLIKQAIGILLTCPRIPQIYYGTELLFPGDGWRDGDGNMRQDFPGGWETDTQNMFEGTTRFSAQKDFYEYVKKLLKWRKDCKLISEGKTMQFLPQKGVYGFARYDENEVAIVLVNLGKFNQQIQMRRYDELLCQKRECFDVLDNSIKTIGNEHVVNRKSIEILIFNVI